MSHQVVYRKYRSQSFLQLIGQEHIVQTLSNQIKSDSIGHAYLFFGPRGCGKTSTARIFAKTINCLTPIQEADVLVPCEKCESCINFSTEDMDIFELDAASNRGIDDARLLREKVISQPISHKYKIVILDEAHMLTREAVNSLLKIIEEPPEYVVFMFCTTEFHKIPITIASRCQRFKFLLAKESDIKKKLEYICQQEKIEVKESDLNIIIKLAKGSFRDSESLLEQFIHTNNNNYFDDLFSLYNDKNKIDNFIDYILKDKIEELWNFLCDLEQNQEDLKQLLDVVVERGRELVEAKKMEFKEFTKLIRLSGGFRNGGKEEFLYLLCRVQDKISQAEEKTFPHQSTTPTANAQKRVEWDAPVAANNNKNSVYNVEKQVQPSTVKAIQVKNEVGVFNESGILKIFADKVGIYSILLKSRVVIEGEIVKIFVNSTVSKIYLQKNKVGAEIMDKFKEVKDVIIDFVHSASNISEPNKTSEKSDIQGKKDAGGEVSVDLEEIFGSKFQ